MKCIRITSLLLVLLHCGLLLNAQSLESYIALALEANPGIQAGEAAWQSAQWEKKLVGDLPDPVVNLGVFALPVETRVGAQRLKVGAMQRFPWFGTLAAKSEGAAFRAEAQQYAWQSERNELTYRVTVLWHELYRLEWHIRLWTENLDILRGFEALATTRYEAGRTSLVDVIRVRLRIEDAEIELENLNAKKNPLLSRFNALVYRDPGASVSLPDSLADPVFILDTLGIRGLEGNPQIIELDRRALAFESDAQAARKMGLPSFGVGLEYAMVNPRVDAEVTDNGQDILAPIVSMSIPVFRNKYEAMREQASLRRQVTELRREDLTRRLDAEVDLAGWDVFEAINRIGLYTRQIEESQSALRILLTAYTSDEEPFEEVLRMEQDILRYSMSRIDAVVEGYIGNAMIEYLHGGF